MAGPLAIDALTEALGQVPIRRTHGRVVRAIGPMLEAELPGATVGTLVEVAGESLGEVVGFREGRALIVMLEDAAGVSFGAKVSSRAGSIRVPVGPGLLGRVIDSLARPIDGGPPIQAESWRPLSSSAPSAMSRTIISEPLHTGIRVIDGMLTLGRGQRVAIIAGSGVGKSTLLGMMARHVQADLSVICLVGERGREVREFVEHNLGPEGMKRAVVVAVTSDYTPALQVKSVEMATTIAEHFRDQGANVLLLVDSLTRFAMAQRQIGLAAGEPPTAGGYTPSVFARLAPLLERAGPGVGGGSITGIYTILVEADDIHDPIADAVRGIVDGHVVLSRKLGGHGHYPAVDVLASLSRLMPRVASPEHQGLASRFRDLLATWNENEELVRLGAYRRGTMATVDLAIDRQPSMTDFLQQGSHEPSSPEQMLQRLREAVGDAPVG